MAKTETKLPRLIDADALRATLDGLAARAAADSPAVRAALLARLKDAMLEGRAQAERLLKQDGLGTLCARRLSDLQDTVIQAIFAFAAERVYPSINRSAAERLAVVAVGGYGRGTLAPGSDIDLLFLLPYKQTPWGESVVEYILYMLWDLGLKVGHATRSVDECMRQARGDMTIRTAVLEARYIWGDKPLFDDLQARFDREVVKGTGPEFIAAKLAERDQRHQRTGSSRYLVEPNVKDGKGGLRDLHTLFWIGKYFFHVETGEALVAAGVFSRAELNRFRKCEDFLWAIRCHLHFMTGRAEERLSFELQRDMAVRLGYTTHPGLRDVERFMKHYFLIAKEVGDLTRIFCAALEERHGKPVSRLNRFLGFVRAKPRAIELTDFIILNERISIADPEAFSRDPVNLLRIFEIADRTELAIHPDALKALARSLSLIDHALRENEEANRLFVTVLTSRRQPETVLRLMNETGVLGRFIPDFGRIVSMMQFNLYHHYTVDEHLIRAIGMLSEIERGERAEEHPLSNAIIGTVDRTVLYIALFLHDIAKGRPEDHSIAGARVARRLCPRLGLSPADTALVAWLVEHHLDMSMVAQSRDLGDRKTILDFAAVAQNIDRLKLLTVLTVADIKAVGPGVWNGWKGQLLRTLYYEVEPVLTGGHSQVSRDRRVRAAKAELAASLADWPEAERAAYLERHYPAYWLRVDLPRKLAHAAMIREADRAGRTLATRVATHDFHAVTEITVLAPDHPRLLSIIAGACTLAGANIVDAQIFTTVDGAALDTIFVSREFSSDADEERRAGKIGGLIEDVLTGRMQLPEVVASRAKPRPRLKAFSVEPRVITDNSWSNQYTAIEASGLDRPGLLYDLTHAISDLNLNIGSAHVATFGERVVDVFYVTDLMGQKIINRAREANIRDRLLKVWTPPERARGAAASPRSSVPA